MYWTGADMTFSGHTLPKKPEQLYIQLAVHNGQQQKKKNKE